LGRLIRDGALTELVLVNEQVILEDGYGSELLGRALRQNCTLTSLSLHCMCLGDEAAVGSTVISCLTAHPSLRKVDVSFNSLDEPVEAPFGAALFALVAANTPVLQDLRVMHCWLTDRALGPLFEALPRNTHLRTLMCEYNGMSQAFARDRLLPAVRANTSLRVLVAVEGCENLPHAREAQALVARRAAALN
jgi:hypothetical protein